MQHQNLRKEPRRVVHKMHHIAIDEKNPGVVLDISPSGLGVMCEVQLEAQHNVVLNIKGKADHLEALVAWCKLVPVSGNVIKAKTPFRWRAGLKFNFRSDQDRELVEKLVQSL